MIKVLIADDHSILRSGLKKILNEEIDIEIFGEAANHNEVLAFLSSKVPDIVLLDISMPGKDGLDTLKEIKTNYPKTKVLILSMHPEDRYAVRAIKSGASGYVSKQGAAEELVTAIRHVSGGRKYVSSTLAEKLVKYYESELDKPPHELLSDREFQVLCMIASGKTVAEIGEALYISPSTVATYRSRILTKLQLNLDTELTAYALKNKLID
jgi:two-component system, NarL family, invasion response regulator UvrY